MSRSPGLHTLTLSPSTEDEIRRPPTPVDALSNPSNDDLVGAGLSLWPSGAAWGSPDGQAIPLASNLARFTRVLLDPFVWLYQRATALSREASVAGVYELLPEWERDYGLPDSCVAGETTFSERLRALEAKVISQSVVHPSDVIRVAAAYGFEIEIKEPAIYQCGFSECGGEHEIGSPLEEVFWIVYLSDLAFDYFRTGESEVGRDLLFSSDGIDRLMCLLRRIAPAWTIPVLADDPLQPPFDLPQGAAWVTVNKSFPPQYVRVGNEFVYTWLMLPPGDPPDGTDWVYIQSAYQPLYIKVGDEFVYSAN